jgi:hypothetical protein
MQVKLAGPKRFGGIVNGGYVEKSPFDGQNVLGGKDDKIPSYSRPRIILSPTFPMHLSEVSSVFEGQEWTDRDFCR